MSIAFFPPTNSVDFKLTYMYCIFKFAVYGLVENCGLIFRCKHISYWARILSYCSSNMGIMTTKSQSIEVQNLTKFQYSNTNLTWTIDVWHGGQNQVTTKIAYIPYVCVLDFLEGECGDLSTLMEWNMHKNLLTQKDVMHPIIKNHFRHTW